MITQPPTPAANTPKAPGLPLVPPVQGTDTVSQMQAYLKQSGYTPPPASAATNGSDWYSKVVQTRKDTSDASLGGFGKVVGDIGQSFNDRADQVEKIKESTDSAPSKILQVAGQGAGAVTDTVGEVIKSAIKPEVLKQLGDIMGQAADSPFVTAMAHSPTVQNTLKWWNGLTPEKQRNLSAGGDIANLMSNAFGVGAAKEAAPVVFDAAKEAAIAGAENVVAPVVDATKAAVKAPITAAKEAASTVAVEPLKAKLGSTNAASGLEASATRLADQAPLIGAGAAREAQPLDIYNTAARDAAAHLKDPTVVDKPSENFGKNEVSSAFNEVLAKKSAAGKTMGDELAKPEVGGSKTDIKDAQQSIIDEVGKQKLNYDPKQQKLISLVGQSPLGQADRRMVGNYIKDLGTLGTNPTVEDVNNFIRRTNADLDLYNQKVGGTTNAERIIKDNLSKLRETISAKSTGNPALKTYSDAKKEFERLSKITETGIPLLGKKSLDGGFIRDASTAKRAIQSLSDGGSKDFMRALEKETGRPLMDKAFVILQAEKDAGISSAHSLLDLFSKDSALKVPTSLRGKLMDWALNHTARAVTGSPADQTRAFLKSLGKKK